MRVCFVDGRKAVQPNEDVRLRMRLTERLAKMETPKLWLREFTGPAARSHGRATDEGAVETGGTDAQSAERWRHRDLGAKPARTRCIEQRAKLRDASRPQMCEVECQGFGGRQRPVLSALAAKRRSLRNRRARARRAHEPWRTCAAVDIRKARTGNGDGAVATSLSSERAPERTGSGRGAERRARAAAERSDAAGFFMREAQERMDGQAAGDGSAAGVAAVRRSFTVPWLTALASEARSDRRERRRQGS